MKKNDLWLNVKGNCKVGLYKPVSDLLEILPHRLNRTEYVRVFPIGHK